MYLQKNRLLNYSRLIHDVKTSFLKSSYVVVSAFFFAFLGGAGKLTSRDSR